jgi:hypothetical protein
MALLTSADAAHKYRTVRSFVSAAAVVVQCFFWWCCSPLVATLHTRHRAVGRGRAHERLFCFGVQDGMKYLVAAMQPSTVNIAASLPQFQLYRRAAEICTRLSRVSS